MTPDRHRRAKEVFLRACELAPEERARFLDHACGRDADLRELVETLLAYHREPDSAPDGRAADGAAAAARLAAGRVVDGKYVVETRLGVGGMGEVYRARQLALDRAVAIKVLPPDPHPESRRRFEREARAIARLRHAHVVTVHDLGVAAGVGPYLVMEYVDGRTLRDELRRREALPVAEAVALARQVCEGTAAAHAAGVIHRDLKPENVLLEGEGERATAKVADFGIARLAESPGAGTESLTYTGAVIGTAHYMSPEQCRGEEADARSDVYAIGCVLYELLSGRPPFQAESVLALLEKHRTEAPVALGELQAEVPADLDRVVVRALAKAPERRWQSAAELGEALASVALGDEIAETAAVETPWPAGPTAPGNLPLPLTRCIGRECELSELTALLVDEAVRLVTITGAGGIGKTRLAVDVARALAPTFPDGVFEVDLAALSDPALLAQHVAHVFGVKESAGGPVAANLAGFLRRKRLLMVLDNFEHLLSAAPLVARLLEAAPELKALVTSQAPLHVRGEREYPLEALEVPEVGDVVPLEDLARSPAVALFVERAREAKPAFSLTDENARVVADICRRLDGLPLAIELAAARVKVLTPAALLARLERRLTLLTGGARDLPERQRTMRGAVAWSYELLGDEEKSLLRRMAVFAGGCTLPAAEAVCGQGGVDVLEGLGSLVDKSLLRRREPRGGETRFRMLEVVREFALERLEAEGEGEEARFRHAQHFHERALGADPSSRGEEASWIASLGRDHENLSLALSVLLEREPRDGVMAMLASRRYWTSRNLLSEGVGWAQRALASGGAGPGERAALLAFMGACESLLGERDVAGAHVREAVEAARAHDDMSVLLDALAWGAISFLPKPEAHAQARAYLEEALEIARAIGDAERAAAVLLNLAAATVTDGDRERVRAYTEEALSLTSSPVKRARCLLNLGDFALEDGDLAGAAERHREALVVLSALGDRSMAAFALESLAEIALGEGAAEKAVRLAAAVEAVYDATGGVRMYVTREPWERTLAKLRDALEPAAFEREWARGRAMRFEEAVEEALGGRSQQRGSPDHHDRPPPSSSA
jgi:predicted ATPase/predicted Ser/Thr protein kinase